MWSIFCGDCEALKEDLAPMLKANDKLQRGETMFLIEEDVINNFILWQENINNRSFRQANIPYSISWSANRWISQEKEKTVSMQRSLQF
ncbi:hypothetical protein NPIL_610531 [Nephila pilipes]|uniref:Uncharacterized protein n=1 Tax=Nephila pilipes TaxID=299642 RepID=A0A8X6UI79_NEPPI|nr:hypothetical protein NPIL_610531 [Nephila pilipes]